MGKPSRLYSRKDQYRVVTEAEAGQFGGRSEFRRDYGRLLHSPCFRRLQGKTQLFPNHESDFFRNRLTHSLEVAQVAKGIALQLNASEEAFQDHPIDTDLVELSALAHDLGHPPFGHNGELALDYCMRSHGGFEGNAQTLRLLARIEKKVFEENGSEDPEANYCGISQDGADHRVGLNFTYRSLASVLKYDRPIPGNRENKSKRDKVSKGYYESEATLVKAIKQHVCLPPSGQEFKTIECQIMDLADDIAYSTYDLEDAMKGGFVHPLAIRARLTSDPGLVQRVHEEVVKALPQATEADVFYTLQTLFDLGEVSSGSEPDEVVLELFTRSTLLASQGRLRVGFTSNLVGAFMRGIRVKARSGKNLRFSKVSLDPVVLLQIESLKHLNYQTMIMSPRLKVVEHRGFELICTLFERLASDGGHLLLPEDYQLMHSRAKDESARKRLICDFIAGMTDRYAAEFHGRLSDSGTSIFKPL